MKNILFFIFILTVCHNSKAQDKKYSSFINEVNKYIDTIKSISLFEGKNNVYRIELYSDKEDTFSFCSRMTYIINKFSYHYDKSEYAFNIGSEIVILDLSNFTFQSWISKINYLPIDSTYKNTILNKLLQIDAATDGGEELLFCYKKSDQILRQFYSGDSHIIPPQFLQIYKSSKLDK